MTKVLVAALMLVVASGLALAQTPPPGGAPEIDPGSAATAVALLSGALLIIRTGRKK